MLFGQLREEDVLLIDKILAKQTVYRANRHQTAMYSLVLVFCMAVNGWLPMSDVSRPSVYKNIFSVPCKTF